MVTSGPPVFSSRAAKAVRPVPVAVPDPVPVADAPPQFGSSLRSPSKDGPSAFDGFDNDDDDGFPASAPVRGAPVFGSQKAASSSGPSWGGSQKTVGIGIETEEVVGRLDNLRTINEWAVGSIWNEERRQMKITGTGLADLTEGLEYVFVGFKKQHPQHGESLEVVAATPHISPNPMAITRFIASNFKGIGLAKADRFVKTMLEERGEEGLEALREKLINDPQSVDLTALASEAVYQPKGSSGEDGDSSGLGRQSVVFRDLATRLSGVPGLKANILKALAAWLVAKAGPYPNSEIPPGLAQGAWAILAQDPYTPMQEVAGYSWLSAEAIGRVAGVPRDLPRRLSALTQYALSVGCEAGGHAYLETGNLKRQVLQLDGHVEAAQAVSQAIRDGWAVEDEDGRVYPPKVLRAEMRLASGLANLLAPCRPLLPKAKGVVDVEIARLAKELGFEKGLDPSQLDAVSRIVRSPVRLHTLFGGPGCGKTTVMEVLAKMLPGKKIVFATPTGKAAKVLHSRVAKHGLYAATLHSTLGCHGEGEFRRGPDDPLEADVFVIDEASMPDLELVDAAVAAMADGAHVVFVGDPEQLPSIGPGRVLKDLLVMDGVDHNKLTTPHRNSGGILALVDSCRRGDLDLSDAPGVQFSRGLKDASEQMGDVAGAYMNAVQQRGFDNVILLMSRRKGDEETPGWNTTYANAVLRGLCNPHAVKIAGTPLHIGDRVIIRKNMAIEQRGEDGEPDKSKSESVVNGDVGTIRNVSNPRNNGISKSLLPQWIDISLDDGRVINLPGQSAVSLGHAYALTVHAAQGSEYQEVILVATPGHQNFVNRAMLLTGLSRPREQIRVFANDADLVKIAATPAPARNTALVQRVADARSEPIERDRMRT